MIHSVYFLTDVASVTNQPLLLLQFLIYLDGWLITIPPSHTSGSPLLFPMVEKEEPRNEGTIKMEYMGEPLPEKIPWEGEFTLRSDP